MSAPSAGPGSRIEVLPVEGLPEIRQGDDLAALIAARTRLVDGDVVVVTQKIVSKAEGRVVPLRTDDRDAERREWALRESVRIVARRPGLIIAETRHGFVCANAGVDGSNVPSDSVSLLPEDPDASAERIRLGLRAATGATVAVIVSDTFGRPWRVGQVNVAIGVAGLPAVHDHAGTKDPFGNELRVTQIAVADEIASAAELAMGKVAGVPVAVLRGLGASGEGTARSLVRREGDMFRSGVVEALEGWRPTRSFSTRPVQADVVERAAAAAAGTSPLGERGQARTRAGDSAGEGWRLVWLRSAESRQAAESSAPGSEGEIAVLAAHTPADLLAAGAALQAFTTALGGQGIGSRWLGLPAPKARDVGLGGDWEPLGVIAFGYPEEPAEDSRSEEPGPLDVR